MYLCPKIHQIDSLQAVYLHNTVEALFDNPFASLISAWQAKRFTLDLFLSDTSKQYEILALASTEPMESCTVSAWC